MIGCIAFLICTLARLLLKHERYARFQPSYLHHRMHPLRLLATSVYQHCTKNMLTYPSA